MLQIRGTAKSEEAPIQVTERAAAKVLALYDELGG